MNNIEENITQVGEQGPDRLGYWGSCFGCLHEIVVYEEISKEGQERAEQIMENEYDWLFADGTWVCPSCQGYNTKEDNTMTEVIKNAKLAKTKPTKPTTAIVDWSQILEQFNSNGGQVLFIKKRVRVRLAPFKTVDDLFVPCDNYFKGKKSIKYMTKVIYLDAPEGTEPLRALLLSKRDIRTILGLQLEGWELFDPNLGHALSLIRSGSGTDSIVSASPSPQVLALSEEQLEAFENFDIQAVADSYSKSQLLRAETENGDKPDKDDEDYN